MKGFFIYRGHRLKLSSRYLMIKWGLILSAPFFLALVAYHYCVTYPFFAKAPPLKQWTIYILPVLVTLGFLLLAFCFSGVVIRFSRLHDGFFMRRYKMQLLARFLSDSNMVSKKIVKTEKGTREKRHLTKAYYRHKKDLDAFTFQTGTQFHNQVLALAKPLSEIYISDLVNVHWEMGYIRYDFLTDTKGKRLNVDQVKVSDGHIKLMKGVSWDFEGLPHMIITGGTGGGKTYFIYALIRVFAQMGRVHLADPKMADLASFSDFKAFKGLVVDKKEDIIEAYSQLVELMDKRYLYMRKQPNYKIGENYRYYDMKPEFVILDELSAFVTTLKDFKEQDTFFDSVRLLVLKARQAGIFLIFATQRPDTTTLPGALRDNMLCKVSLGVLTDQGYEMTFPNNKDKAFINKDGLKGRGYIDVGTGVPVEFYSPFVPKTFDFIDYFKNLPEMPYTDVSKINIKKSDREVLKEVYESVDEGETFFIEQEKEKARQAQVVQKDKQIEKVMAKAGISYKEAMKQSAKEAS